MDCKIENRLWLRIDYMNENDAEVEKIKRNKCICKTFSEVKSIVLHGKVNMGSEQEVEINNSKIFLQDN